MTVTAWRFLFNTEILFQGNVKCQRAAILKCDISLSEIYVMNIHNRDCGLYGLLGVLFSVLMIVKFVISVVAADPELLSSRRP